MSDPIDISARWAIRLAVEAWQEEAWENYLPDVGEYDFERICDKMNELLPKDITVGEYGDAYNVLTERATEE